MVFHLQNHIMSLLWKLKQLSRGGGGMVMMLMWTSIMSTHIQTGDILQAQRTVRASLKRYSSQNLSIEYQTLRTSIETSTLLLSHMSFWTDAFTCLCISRVPNFIFCTLSCWSNDNCILPTSSVKTKVDCVAIYIDFSHSKLVTTSFERLEE